MKKGFMNSIVRIFATISCVAFLAGCNSSDNEPDVNNRKDIDLPVSSRATAEELQSFYTRFTIDAINCNNSNQEIQNKNVIVSPLSASMLLGMLANGTDQVVAKQITDYLGISDLEALNELSHNLLVSLPTVDSKSKIEISNSIWNSNDWKLNSNYTSVMSEKFRASSSSIDFGNPAAAETINKWIENKTNGIINSYYDFIEPSTILVILNTLYYKGEWADEAFNPKNTKQETFYGLNNNSTVSMMHSEKIHSTYAKTDNYEACVIPFGNTAFSMTLVLPNKDSFNTENFRVITDQEIANLNGLAVYENVKINLPKFMINHKLNLKEVLNFAGLNTINGLIPLKMFENEVERGINLEQGASLSIDEKGAEVAVVSNGEVIMGDAPTKTMVFDHPFYFFITERSTGACILSGFIADL
ncbi:MAG: hypothetical protein K2J82_04270 [Muribaculaceae bacterium]|nr:hypothetical protein [Muribaculaceae bacterium]